MSRKIIQIITNGPGVRFLLIASAPIREEIYPYGPFVTNTMEGKL